MKTVLPSDTLLALNTSGPQMQPIAAPPPIDLSPIMAAMAQQAVATAQRPVLIPTPQAPQISSNNAAATALLGLTALAGLGVGIADAAGAFDSARTTSSETPQEEKSASSQSDTTPTEDTQVDDTASSSSK